MEPSLLWYDFETYGAGVSTARPVQVGFLRTDLDLEPIDDGFSYHCRPSGDFLPSPLSTAIHGITPQEALREGEIEAEFAAMVFEDMAEPGSCCVGYNSEKFDSKLARFLFWRNYLPPYQAEHENGNSKWDLRTVVLAAFSLRPDGIVWPRNPDGTFSLRLEDLARENGLDHGLAHDALSDVEATVALARLVRSAQPQLYDYSFNLRTTNATEDFVQANMGSMVAHVSPFYGYDRRSLAPVLLVARSRHAEQKREVFGIDLGRDPDVLFRSTADELRSLFYAKAEDLEGPASRPPMVRLRTNECPFVAPIKTIHGDPASRAGIDLDLCAQRAERLRAFTELPDLLREVFGPTSHETLDVDEGLYGTFIPRKDEARLFEVRNADPDDLRSFRGRFADPRLNELLARYRGRNYPETLDPGETAAWRTFCRDRLVSATADGRSRYEAFRVELAETRATYAADPDRLAKLDDLESYCESLVAGLGGAR
jgi:exodeoxyribonuclease-1